MASTAIVTGWPNGVFDVSSTATGGWLAAAVIVTLATGSLYAALGGHGFFVMAAIAALGLLLALKAMGKEVRLSL